MIHGFWWRALLLLAVAIMLAVISTYAFQRALA